jgi:hypothetical protein
MRLSTVLYGILVLLAASTGIAAPARATPTAPLVITSDGSAGDPFAGYSSASFILNTDNGMVLEADNSGNYIGIKTLASSVVTQSDGSQVRVFNFTNFTVPLGDTVNVSGSLAAAIVASGNIQIDGTLNAGTFKLGNGIGAAAGGFLGGVGAPSDGAAGAGGGGGGIGTVAHITDPCCGYNQGSGGGGGGNVSSGQAGGAGTLFPGGVNGTGGTGGNAMFNLNVLEGGAGGGAGAGGYDCCEAVYGNNGGQGGGALLLETPGNIMIGTNGMVAANGQNGLQGCGGQQNGGGGGGGAGGTVWFDANGTVINRGQIQAMGGAGGAGPCAAPAGWGGAGSGGAVVIDPLSIENYGIINVSDGNGTAVVGGQVYTFGQDVLGTGTITGQADIPEPANWIMLLSSLGILGAIRHRIRRDPRAA